MNNEQFRRLLVEKSPSGSKESATPRNAAPGGATPSALGSRMRSSIPMTPRSVTGLDFARQLAEHRREGDQRPSKRFKSSAAPKGTKLPSGYQDRAQQRNAEADNQPGEDLQARIKALEEMVKLGQIDQATFEKLRAELGVGGDTSSTHMIKGLDWKLLKRVKAGEDVSQTPEKSAPPPTEEAPTEKDDDEEFERLMEEKGLEEIHAVPKQTKEKKKGTMAPPPPPKKTRDEILRELKAARAAAVEAPAPLPESTLGSRFKKLGDGKPEKKRFVEQDENGRRREVLLITDAAGKTKRKVRWLDKPGEASGSAATTMPMPGKAAKPLGMEVPAEIAARAAADAAAEEEDDDIFAGVGDYNPLAGLEEDDGSSSDEDSEIGDATAKREQAPISEAIQQPPAPDAAPAKPRDYFASGASSTVAEEPEDRSNPLTKDPTILAALKRAAALRQASPSAGDEEGQSSDADLRGKRFLEEARRRDAQDAADMDLGFGGSRNEDEAEEEGVLLEFEDQRGGKKRKRGPKKKKGDKDSAADVMRVVEGRKKEAN
ncbi:hypothetical protein NUU61_002678 [Penicillium alfredii]|uniref:RED-like N-terminal domain-containing protein n=1 Tax=Penicillium alfredii TaxID=1506179 RepID=A0A9W9KGU1_9EURO|nr:uncharacterized protein NUU61_002678 [Penicillium alfredii]KAJ5105331.1 hypothetical protein NUU61_002678 [Penicillium alfredii]